MVSFTDWSISSTRSRACNTSSLGEGEIPPDLLEDAGPAVQEGRAKSNE